MSNVGTSLPAIRRRAWIGLVLAELALFVIANLTAKSSSHPGGVSNAFFITFLIGAALLIALAVTQVITARRRASR